jgi:hypothetical protein
MPTVAFTTPYCTQSLPATDIPSTSPTQAPCTYLDKANVSGVLPEALTADVQVVLADDTALVAADLAAKPEHDTNGGHDSVCRCTSVMKTCQPAYHYFIPPLSLRTEGRFQLHACR